jgi:hypothetical protein
VVRILHETHLFFVQFPMSYWKTRPSDTPMRTIKTILNELVTQMGDRVLDYADHIDQPENSQVMAYLRKCLRDKPKESLPGQVNEDTDTDIPQTTGADSVADSLSAILRVVADKEHTKQGIRELHEFKLAHPEYSLEPWFAKSSTFFRSYVERCLKDVEHSLTQTQAAVQPVCSVAAVSSIAVPEYPGSAPTDPAHRPQPLTITHPDISRKFKELQELRAKGGLPPSKIYSDMESSVSADRDSFGNNNNHDIDENKHNATNDDDQQPKRAKATPQELNALRQRLQMVKRGVL